jgi:hypothetical protein
MPLMVNKSKRPISVGGVLMTPSVPANIPDDFMNNPRVKQLIEEKVFEPATATPAQPAPTKVS